ncbi:hypothetical protein [Polaribacter sp.]|uniref:hypothetical protein n=1 Tax=Polaribacter sp. TaxID=1920175 RepID=UPI003EF70B81
MKTFKSILILSFFAFIATSCGSDDDPVISLSSASFAGTYNLTYLQSTEVQTQSINGGTIVTTIKIVGDTFTNSTFTFASAGTFTSNDSYRITTTTSVTGNSPSEESEIISGEDSGTFSLDVTNRTVIIDGIKYTISLFNESELRLKHSSNVLVNSVETDISEELRFTR